MTSKTYRPLFALPVAVLMLVYLAPVPARADFFDNARQTFTVNIPHFFQDDIPCFFGGKPTSGARKSCKSPGHPVKSAAQTHTAAHSKTANKDLANGSYRPSNSAQQQR